jgi:Ulp1 family protease
MTVDLAIHCIGISCCEDAEYIYFKDIQQIFYGIVSADRQRITSVNTEAFIHLLIHPETLLENITVGKGKLLDPTTNGKDKVNHKYISLCITYESLNDMVENVFPFLENSTEIKIFNKSKDQSMLSPLLSSDKFTKSKLQKRLSEERDAERLKSSRKKRSSDKDKAIDLTGPNRVHPEDGNTYLIYPTAVDTADAVTVSCGDLKRIHDGAWFNDNLIDIKVKHYFNSLDHDIRLRIHAFSCLFYPKLDEEDCRGDAEDAHKLVHRWTKDVDLFEKDFLLIPISLNLHWSLVVVMNPKFLLDIEANSSKYKNVFQSSLENVERTCIICMDSLNLHPFHTIVPKIVE